MGARDAGVCRLIVHVAAWMLACVLPSAESRQGIQALLESGLRWVTREWDEADRLFTQALVLEHAQRKPPPSVAVAGLFESAGKASYIKQHLNVAGQLWMAALELEQELAPESLETAATLNELGDVARRLDHLAAAETYYRRSLVIREKRQPRSLAVAQSLNNLGTVAFNRGNLAAAARYYREGLSLRQESAPNSRAVSESLHKLGDVALRLGDVAAAEEYYQRALGLRRNLPDRRDVAGSLNGLGNVARAQGDLAKAKGYYEQALAIAATSAPDSLDVARTLSNLGAVAEGQGDLVLAADYQQRALAIRQRLVPGSLLVAETLSNFAKIASDQGDLPEAERYHRRSLSIRENQSPESLLVATSLNDLGAMARAHADVAKAAAYYEQALVLREKLAPRSLTVAESLYSLSDLALQLGNRIEAERWAGQAWGLVRQQATVVNGDEARQAFDRSTARYAAQLIRCQLALGETRAAFTTLEQSRAQALQQLIADRRFIAGLTDDGRWRIYRSALLARDRHEYDLSRAVAAEAQARQELANLDSQQASGDPVTRAVSHLREAAGRVQQEQSDYTLARVRADELWADIKDRASPASAPPLSFTQAQIVVPPGAVFVAFDTAAEQIHLFVLRRGATDRALLSVYTLDLSPEQLERRVRDFHDCVARPLWGYQCVRLARQLYNGLFPIPARHLMANAARIIISPDGPLWDVPFAALVVNAAGAPEYLGEQKPITYATSLTCFAQSRSELPRLPVGMAPRALVVGQTRGLLPYSRREAEQVAALYGSHPLTGAAATETTVRARIGGADVIHLATHSLSLPLPMSSGIVLAESGRAAPGDDSSEDGLLQAWEIQSQLKLRAELVVLSACNTGAGQVVPEEGIIGLTRALQYAGARSIVASKWEAEDRSTATLMVAFHGYLRQGLAKDEALRRAMSNVRRHPGTARPYYWASFFLLGDPDNPSLGVGRCPDECSG